MSVAAKAPALALDRGLLATRATYDYSDYGFVVSASLGDTFEIVPSRADDQEAFLFFYPKRDLEAGTFCLFNLHAFLKKTESLDDFAHGLGNSMKHVPLADTRVLGVPARTYARVIAMRDLFDGAPQVIDFIGGTPDLKVRDSHTYFRHRHNHYYTGMLHEPGADAHYDALRAQLFDHIRLV
jgi:hypothetical protein